MKSNPVITSAGHYLPVNIISNGFLDSLDIGSDGQWIVDRVGIRERRSVLTPDQIRQLRFQETSLAKLKASGLVMEMSQMLEEAGKVAVERHSGSTLTDADVCIASTSTPDYDVPANACKVATHIGAHTASSFDINSACSSFVVSVASASAFIRQGTFKKAVCAMADRFTLFVDYSNRKNCILFGDSASLVVVEDNVKAPGLEVLDTVFISNPVKWNAVTMPNGEWFDQDGTAVQKFAISKTIEVTDIILEKNHLKPEDVSYFIGHQANYRMLNYVERHYGFAAEQHLHNIQDAGNQGCSGGPVVLSQNWDKFKSGDVIVVSLVGAGLTWGAMLLRCR